MKNIYILAILVFGFVQMLSAQQDTQYPRLLETPEAVEVKRTHMPVRTLARELIWSEDFNSGWNSSNGPWTTEGPDGDIWEYTNTVAAGCWSESGEEAVNFTTKDNGFMIYHPDAVNCNDPAPDPPIFNETVFQGSLISPSIDLSATPAVLVSFEHRFRYCCNNEFMLLFSVSTDDGNSWVDYDILGGTDVNAYNSELVSKVNISQVAAGEENVLFKFTWNASGTASHYFWALDDIIVEIPVDTDLRLVDMNYQQFDPNTAVDYTDVKHTIYHISQIRPLNLQAMAINNGAVDQENVSMQAVITTPTEPITLDALSQNIAVGDTGIFEIPYTPESELGVFSIVYRILPETEDEIPEDNLDSLTFEIDDNYFARDERTRDGSFTNYVDNLKTALAFTLTEPATIYGVAIGIAEGSELGTFFSAQLMDDDFNFITESEFITVENWMLNAMGDEIFVQLPLMIPHEAAEGESIFPAFEFFGGDEVAEISLSGTCPDFTCYVWADIASNGQECNPCYYSSVPMIRPLFAEDVSLKNIEDQYGISLGQNVPNPAMDYTIIVLDLDTPTDNVSLEIVDLHGRTLFNKEYSHLPAGKHTETIDLQHMNAGFYLYSLTADGHRQTRRMTKIN